MKERPILFSGRLVRAILEDRKTVTRRVVKVTHRTPGLAAALLPPAGIPPRPHVAAELCPYGKPGDRLWVREAWKPISVCRGSLIGVHYRADDERADVPWVEGANLNLARPSWRPSIHMPRWASRIQLEVTEVRVERLQDITPDEAIAEGAVEWSSAEREATGRKDLYDGRKRGVPYLVNAFAETWDSLNAARGYGWDANPWVWVIRFRRLA